MPEDTIDLVKMFLELNFGILDETGIHPSQGIAVFPDKQIIMAFADVQGAMRHIRQVFLQKPESLIFGLDRFLKDEQGTQLGDGLSVSYYRNGRWRFGIIEYQFEPRIVKEVNWTNQFWNRALAAEVRSVGIPCQVATV